MSSSTKNTTTSRKPAAAKKETVAAAAAPIVAAPVVVPVVAAVAPVVAAVAPVVAAVAEVDVVTEFNGLVSKMNELRSTIASVFSEMKKLEKRIPRELKKASKGRRARKTPELNADGTEKPKKDSVFTRPSQISEDLCKFLGKPVGTLMSRSEVTTAVCAYAKTKGLMEKQNIKADAALRKLLALKADDELKILNLQRFLKPHYIKAVIA